MPPRKRLRNTKATERAGVNALRDFLEARECVVQEVDTANDFGKDLLVDLTEDHEITGQTIAIQVKSGRSFLHKGMWGIPAKPVDLNTWLESSIPMFGVVFDPDSQELHWMNLSAYVHEEMDALHEHKNLGKGQPIDRDRFRGHFVAFPSTQVLKAETWDHFTSTVNDYGRRFRGRSLLDLMTQDEVAQLSAITDCFALGRGDVRALLLIRHSITKLSGWALMAAITSLSHCAPHPDMAWSKKNWIPQQIRNQVVASFDWSPDELLHMIQGLEEASNEGYSVWERGGCGQSFVVILWDAPNLCHTLSVTLSKACRTSNSDTAFRTLILYQYFLGIKGNGTDLVSVVGKLMSKWPRLSAHPLSKQLIENLEEYGWVDIF